MCASCYIDAIALARAAFISDVIFSLRSTKIGLDTIMDDNKFKYTVRFADLRDRRCLSQAVLACLSLVERTSYLNRSSIEG
jgi:hypothetical protein